MSAKKRWGKVGRDELTTTNGKIQFSDLGVQQEA